VEHVKIAFLFAGQGTDLSVIGSELTHAVPDVGRLVDTAAAAVGVRPEQLWERGGRLLEATAIYQPVFTAVTLGITAALRAAGVAPQLVAGHSLGELPAWCAAGCLHPHDAIAIAAVRGTLMAARAAELNGGMVALRGADAVATEHALALGRAHGHVHIAAINAPDEVVLGGDNVALQALMAGGAVTRVPVPGPWHGPPMAAVSDAFARALAAIDVHALQVPVVSTVTGDIVSDGSQMRALLVRQLVEPVRWADAMTALARDGITDIVTVGPGRILRGFVYSNRLAGVHLHATDRPDLLARTIERLGT
jgi:[acyl-carrier-protein] S-malonyltransferase